MLVNKTVITTITAVAFIFSYGLRADVQEAPPKLSGKDTFPPGEPPIPMEEGVSSSKKVAASDILPGDPNDPGIFGDIMVEPSSPRASKDIFPGESEAAITGDPSADTDADDVNQIPSSESQEIIGDGPDLPDQEAEENELYSSEEKEVSRSDDPDDYCARKHIFLKNIYLAAAAVIVAVVAIILVSIHEGHNK